MSIRFFSQVFSPNSDKGADSTIRISLQHTYGQGKKMEVKDSKLAIYYRISKINPKRHADGSLVYPEDKFNETIKNQEHAVHKYLREDLGLTDEAIAKIPVYQDLDCSGKKNTKRPEYQKLRHHITMGKFDNIVCYKMDRMTRDLTTAIKFMLDLKDYDVGFISVTQPVFQLSTNNPMRWTILMAFAEIAEIEREMIVSRVRDGLAAAKARGVKLGKKKRITEEVDNMILRMHYVKKIPARKIARMLDGVAGKTYCQKLIKDHRDYFIGTEKIKWLKSLDEKNNAETP